MKEACTLMDISLLDHIIVTADEFFSFADNGVLWLNFFLGVPLPKSLHPDLYTRTLSFSTLLPGLSPKFPLKLPQLFTFEYNQNNNHEEIRP